MKKVIVILAVTAMIVSNLFAQEYKEKLLSNDDFFKNSDYILEVKWSKIPSVSYDSKGNYNPDDIYTQSFWIVKYVYKTDGSEKISVGDTVESISKGGEIVRQLGEEKWNIEVINTFPEFGWPENSSNKPVGLSREYNAIVFLRKNNLPENNKSVQNMNFLKINHLQNKFGGGMSIVGNKITGLNGLTFNNREELCEYMRQYESYGININAYFETNNAYWQKKYAELDDFKKNYPEIDLPKAPEKYNLNKNDYRIIYQNYKREVNNYFMNSPLYSLYFDLEHKDHINAKQILKELTDFFNNKSEEISNISEIKQSKAYEWGENSEINLEIIFEDDENDKKKVKSNNLGNIIKNQVVYYDNVTNRNYFEFDIAV